MIESRESFYDAAHRAQIAMHGSIWDKSENAQPPGYMTEYNYGSANTENYNPPDQHGNTTEGDNTHPPDMHGATTEGFVHTTKGTYSGEG